MPITGNQLQAGDILFKRADDSWISKQIKKAQKGIHDRLIRSTGPHPMGGTDAAGVTHVAMAAGPDDVLEFDEGGEGTAKLIFLRGYGFVRGDMARPSRKGNVYNVIRCTAPTLAAAAADKAELIWDMTHQGNAIKASYGIGKLVRQGLGSKVGVSDQGASMTLNAFEAKLDQWLRNGVAAQSSIFKRKPNLKFICSEFVTYCYLWASSDIQYGGKLQDIFGVDYLLGTDKARVSPVELYTRLETVGKSTFQFRGTLYT